MMVLHKGKMEDGTVVQIEDWSEDYSFREYASTIGAYPASKVDYPGQFTPKKGETTRMQYDFESTDKADKAFSELIEGAKTLKDFEANLKI